MTTYRAHYPRMPRTLTREQAVQVIGQHGFLPNAPSAWLPGILDSQADETSFNAEMGVHDTYDTPAVFRWLGYDDMPDDEVDE